MPFPNAIARFSRDVINPVIRHVAGRLPPFSLLEHRGRKSCRLYRTPIMVFPAGNDMIVALTYGPNTDWAQNVLSAGSCAIDYRHRRITLANPRIVHRSPADMPLPRLVRRALTLMTVSDFLVLERVDETRFRRLCMATLPPTVILSRCEESPREAQNSFTLGRSFATELPRALRERLRREILRCGSE